MDVDQLAQLIAEFSALSATPGTGFVDVFNPLGEAVDSIMIEGEEAVWGTRDEFRLPVSAGPAEIAQAVAYTLRDTV